MILFIGGSGDADVGTGGSMSLAGGIGLKSGGDVSIHGGNTVDGSSGTVDITGGVITGVLIFLVV